MRPGTARRARPRCASPAIRPSLVTTQREVTAPAAPRPLPAGRAAAEVAGAVALLAMMTLAWTRWPSWLERLGEFQVAALGGFASLVAVLARAPRYAALSRPGLWVILVAIALRGALWPVVPSLSDDIYRYLWEGRVALAGHDPYALPPSDERLASLRDPVIYPRINHPELSTIYPPLGVAQFALVAAVWPSVAGMKAWVILCDL